MAHTDSVRRIYEAFGRADVAAILSHLADDVEWEYGVSSTDVPWLQPRRGKGHVPEFFQALSALDIRRFEPTRFFEAGNVVVVLIDLEATVRGTGRQIVEDDEVHIWHFDAAGQVKRFRHRVDTHQQWGALQAREGSQEA